MWLARFVVAFVAFSAAAQTAELGSIRGTVVNDLGLRVPDATVLVFRHHDRETDL